MAEKWIPVPPKTGLSIFSKTGATNEVIHQAEIQANIKNVFMFTVHKHKLKKVVLQ